MSTYCDNEECLHFSKLDSAHFLKHARNYKPLGDSSGYPGMCGRADQGIRIKKFESTQVKYEWSVCTSFSNRKIKGHMDWSRFPQGGNISPSADPGTVTPSRFCSG